MKVAAPERTFATLDHIVPTLSQLRPCGDSMAETMTTALERNCREHGIPLFDLASGRQGIVHVIGPELGLTQPGMTICCGDSHTSTHGAAARWRSASASGAATVLASQTIALMPLQGPSHRGERHAGRGVTAKDVTIIAVRRARKRGLRLRMPATHRAHVDGRAHDVVQHVDEGGAVGLMRIRRHRARGGTMCRPANLDRACEWWRQIVSDPDAVYDACGSRRGRHRADRDLGINPVSPFLSMRRCPTCTRLRQPAVRARRSVRITGLRVAADRRHAH
jgi:3-isopropylmalate/(R)-2-methylmalate dehydratase large subunit